MTRFDALMCNHGEHAVNRLGGLSRSTGIALSACFTGINVKSCRLPMLWLGWAADWVHASEAEPAILSINMQKRYMDHSFSPVSICCG